MINRILEIARLYLAITYRSRAMFIFGLFLPVLFTWIIGSAIRQPEPDGSVPTFHLLIVNEDAGTLGTELAAGLEADPLLTTAFVDRAAALSAVEAGEAAAGLFIPPDFSARVISGEPTDLEFAMNLSEPVEAQVVEQALRAALAGLESSVSIAASANQIADRLGLFSISTAPSEQDYFDSAVTAARLVLEENPPAVVSASAAVRGADTDIPNGTNQTSPGMMVVFTMFSTLAGAATLLLEREQGTLRRLLVLPIGKPAIFSGKMLGIFLAGVIQIVILVLAGRFLFGVAWGRDPLALLVMIVAFAFCTTSLGLMMAALARTYEQLNALSTIIVLPLSGLGGAMWPIEIVPPFMQTLALFVPTGWAMRGFHDIVTRGLGVAAVLPEAGVLALFGMAFLAIGVWRFKFE
ncbi:MAG: ABC transporter permease [Anaerolineae bacterium]|nr:MAG: ABC transporter permease [Anaerolineae bacterium]